MTHPSGRDLEAFACGEERPGVARHLGDCDACRSFVERARRVVTTWRRADDAQSFVSRAASSVAASRAREEQRRRRGRWLRALPAAMGGLAAAAALVVLVKTSGAPTAVETRTTGSGATPSAARPDDPEPSTSFKGAVQVAVIRERDGRQERHLDVVRVRPGDRLRLEVALDRERTILGAVLGDDGSYLELMPRASRGPGTHFSEHSARIDANVTRGTLVVGSDEAVARARGDRRLEGVASIRVEWEGP